MSDTNLTIKCKSGIGLNPETGKWHIYHTLNWPSGNEELLMDGAEYESMEYIFFTPIARED